VEGRTGETGVTCGWLKKSKRTSIRGKKGEVAGREKRSPKKTKRGKMKA